MTALLLEKPKWKLLLSSQNGMAFPSQLGCHTVLHPIWLSQVLFWGWVTKCDVNGGRTDGGVLVLVSLGARFPPALLLPLKSY